jgi:hypothetical protein
MTTLNNKPILVRFKGHQPPPIESKSPTMRHFIEQAWLQDQKM